MCPAKQGKVEDTETFIQPVEIDPTSEKSDKAKKDHV